jgi:hypothetical protein
MKFKKWLNLPLMVGIVLQYVQFERVLVKNVSPFITLLFLFVPTVVFCADISGDDVEYLKFVSLKSRSNIESIRNWNGSAKIINTTTVEAGGNITHRYESTVKFAIDRVKNQRLAVVSLDEGVHFKEGKRVSTPLSTTGILLNNDTLYKYHSLLAKGKTATIDNMINYRGTLVISPSTNESEHYDWLNNFNPLFGFNFLQNSVESVIIDMQTPTPHSKIVRKIDMTRSKDICSLSVNFFSDGNKTVSNEYHIDVTKGGSFIQCKSSWSGVYETVLVYELEKANDIWVTKKM